MTNPLITIYILNYNYQNYLEKAILSAINQTYKELEVLIIDDGSTDKSKEIINKYLNRKKIRAIFQKNKGLIKSCNIAIRASKGEFVFRLDADDYIDKNAISILYNKIKINKNIGLVYSNYFVIDKNNNIQKLEFKKKISSKNIQKIFPAHGACSLIRKKYLYEVGLYNEKIDRQDGQDIWLKFFYRYRIENVELPLFYYRMHGKNISENRVKIDKAKNIIFNNFNKNVKKKIYCIIPARGTKFNLNDIALYKIEKKKIIHLTIDCALECKKISKVIITTPDEKIINSLKKYKNKIFIHKRKKNFSYEQFSFRNSILEAIKKYSKFKLPDIIVILTYDYPWKNSIQIEQAINNLIVSKTDKIIGVYPENSKNFYILKNSNLVQIGNKPGILKFEKEIIFSSAGGIQVLDYKKYLNNNVKKTGVVVLDKKATIKIEHPNELKNLDLIKFSN